MIMVELSALVSLVFSRDRAMQLDATLRSFLLHCADGDQAQLTVLYQTTSALHAQQYAELVEEHRPHRNIHFQPQAHFRRDVLAFLADHADLRFGTGLYRRMARLHRRLGFLSQPLLHFDRSRYVLLLVDDNLFVRRFQLAAAINDLQQDPQAIGFSLRLGRNTRYCYVCDRSQSLPEFVPAGDGALRFEWGRSALDFAYPLEVSSSIYRIADLLPLLNSERFASPNQLESRLAENAHRLTHRPYLLCYPQSVVFSNPVNQVAERYQNRSGTLQDYTSQQLAQMFAQGLRVDVTAYAGFLPQSCHQEVELHFQGPGREANGR